VYQAKLNQLGDRSPELSYNLGIALQHGKRLEDAAKAYSHALQTNPSFAEANLNLGHVLKSLGKEAEARACWDKALAIKPDLIQ
jgi:tetratricopeptide (TPR) repeat protein